MHWPPSESIRFLEIIADIRLLVFACVLALLAAGCAKETKKDATKPLQQSFEQAEPEIKQSIQAVTVSLKAGKYPEAAKALEPVVSGRKLTEPQKQAVGLALQQINQALAANPALDTKEMYELRLKLFRAVDPGKH
jgi:hypothetical protein